MNAENVSWREFYQEMKAFRGEVAELRLQLEGLSCARHESDIAAVQKQLAGLQRSRISWKGLAAMATVIASLLGLDKAWDVASQAFRVLESRQGG